MARVPVNFRTTTSPVIASFNFTDLVTKTGYLTFYVCAGTDGTKFLTPIVAESDANFQSTTSSTSGGGEIMHNELDIDIEFKQPQTVKGKLFVVLSYWAYGGNGVASASTYQKVRIYHVTGSTETEIGTQQTTSTISQGSSGQYSDTRETVVFNITGKHFKIGDKLRLNIEQWGNIGTNTSIGLYHDGKNRDLSGRDVFGENVQTDIKCIVPFKINL